MSWSCKGLQRVDPEMLPCRCKQWEWPRKGNGDDFAQETDQLWYFGPNYSRMQTKSWCEKSLIVQPEPERTAKGVCEDSQSSRSWLSRDSWIEGLVCRYFRMFHLSIQEASSVLTDFMRFDTWDLPPVGQNRRSLLDQRWDILRYLQPSPVAFDSTPKGRQRGRFPTSLAQPYSGCVSIAQFFKESLHAVLLYIDDLFFPFSNSVPM